MQQIIQQSLAIEQPEIFSDLAEIQRLAVRAQKRPDIFEILVLNKKDRLIFEALQRNT